MLQGSGAASGDLSAPLTALASLAQGTNEFAEEDKVTIFAPQDEAWTTELPEGEEGLRVCPLAHPT